MQTTDTTEWQVAVLDGGPADGTRVKVFGRPLVIQVTHPCPTETAPGELRAEAVYVYRRDHDSAGEPLRYGYDIASP